MPVAGLRVNATPVAQSSPRFPNTIACTLTAVPIAAEMPCILRYTSARGLFHDRNTAPIAPQSWARTSSGNGCPVARAISALNRATASRSAASDRS